MTRTSIGAAVVLASAAAAVLAASAVPLPFTDELREATTVAGAAVSTASLLALYLDWRRALRRRVIADDERHDRRDPAAYNRQRVP